MAEDEVLRDVRLLGALQAFIDETWHADREPRTLLDAWLAIDAARQVPPARRRHGQPLTDRPLCASCRPARRPTPALACCNALPVGAEPRS